MEIAARDLFLGIKQGKIDTLEARVKKLNLNQNILLCQRDDLLHIVNVLMSEKNQLFSVIRSKNETISDLEKITKNLKDYVDDKNNTIDYWVERVNSQKDIIKNIWEKVAEGNDLNAQKKELYFAKCEKNKALKTKIGGLNEKMNKKNKELRCQEYQIEQLNQNINEIILEKGAITNYFMGKIKDQTKHFGDLTGDLCEWIKNATLNEIQEVKKHSQTLSKQNTRKFILFKRNTFLNRLASPQDSHAHMGKTRKASDESHAHAQFLHRLAPPQGGHALKRKVGSHAQREAPSLEGALSHVGASSRGGALAQGCHALKGKDESHAQGGHAHRGENHAQKEDPGQVSHAQIGPPPESRLWLWIEGRVSAQVSHAQIGAPAQGGHAHKDKDEKGLDTVAMFTIPVEAVDWYWFTEKEFLEKILAGNLDSFYIKLNR